MSRLYFGIKVLSGGRGGISWDKMVVSSCRIRLRLVMV